MKGRINMERYFDSVNCKNIKEIETNYELELAKINNEHELKVRQMDLIEKLIGEIDSIKVEIKIYQYVSIGYYLMFLIEPMRL